MTRRPYLFIAGSPRSGTTLLDKLVSSHPDAHALSQPLPLLYVEAKRWFLEAEARKAGAFPLDDMFGKNYYPPERLTAFLRAHKIEAGAFGRVLEAMIPFEGQYTKPQNPLEVLEDYVSAPLFSIVYRYTERYCPPAACVIGSKETFAEEFVPYFLDAGARVVLVVRDPRDVITSLDYGRGRQFGGRLKPLLFNIRQWRKSVAIALAHRNHGGFLLLRYEDLVTITAECLNDIACFLRLAPFPPAVAENIRDQSGGSWSSNSSHESAFAVTQASVGRHSELLSTGARNLIEATCFPEMAALEYVPHFLHTEVERVLHEHEESRGLERPELADFQWSAARRDEELERWRSVQSGRYRPDQFLFEEAWNTLRRAMADRFGGHAVRTVLSRETSRHRNC